MVGSQFGFKDFSKGNEQIEHSRTKKLCLNGLIPFTAYKKAYSFEPSVHTHLTAFGSCTEFPSISVCYPCRRREQRKGEKKEEKKGMTLFREIVTTLL